MCERISLFYNCLTSNHIKNCDYIKLVKAKKYTLEEKDKVNSSYFVCDGENLNTKKITVENTNLKLNFFK